MPEVLVCSLLGNHNSERKVFLDKIAKHNNNDCRDHLSKDGINMKVFYEEFQENIIKKKANYIKKEIPEQLYSPL